MADFMISTEHNEARLNATRAFADTGSANSRIDLFDAGDVVLATVILAKPCGAVDNGVLTLVQNDLQGDMVLISGTAVRGEWVNGEGVLVASGAVTGQTGDGPFILQGVAGTLLQAGGTAVLTNTEIT